MQCRYCGKGDEPICVTCAVCHTVDKHPFEVALQVADYSSLMRPEFVSRSSWWIAMKVHLELQIERICSKVTRLAPQGYLLMCKQADDCAKKIQDHWDDCKRKNALERNELRIGMGDIAPEGYGGPGEQMNVYYENPFEDLHYHERFGDEDRN